MTPLLLIPGLNPLAVLPDGATFSAYCAGIVSVVAAITTLVKTVQNARPADVRTVRRALQASDRRERRHAADLDAARAGVLTEQAEKARLVDLLAESVIPADHPGTPTGTQQVIGVLDSARQPAVASPAPAAPAPAQRVQPVQAPVTAEQVRAATAAIPEPRFHVPANDAPATLPDPAADLDDDDLDDYDDDEPWQPRRFTSWEALVDRGDDLDGRLVRGSSPSAASTVTPAAPLAPLPPVGRPTRPSWTSDTDTGGRGILGR